MCPWPALTLEASGANGTDSLRNLSRCGMENRGQRSVAQVNAAKLGRRRLPVFELRAVERFMQAAEQSVARLSFSWSGNPATLTALEALQCLTSVFEIVGNRLVRKIA